MSPIIRGICKCFCLNYQFSYQLRFDFWVFVFLQRSQQDALEFFTYLVDGLHEGIKERSQTPNVSDPPSSPTIPSTPLPAIQKDHRLKRRCGGLKTSENSGHLTGGDRKASWDDSSESSTRYFKKIARKFSEKVLRPLRSEGSYDVPHDTHQPAVWVIFLLCSEGCK